MSLIDKVHASTSVLSLSPLIYLAFILQGCENETQFDSTPDGPAEYMVLGAFLLLIVVGSLFEVRKSERVKQLKQSGRAVSAVVLGVQESIHYDSLSVDLRLEVLLKTGKKQIITRYETVPETFRSGDIQVGSTFPLLVRDPIHLREFILDWDSFMSELKSPTP